jgi:hypothetical protein
MPFWCRQWLLLMVMLEEGARVAKLLLKVRDMRIQGDSREKTRNAKSRNSFLVRPVVTAKVTLSKV